MSLRTSTKRIFVDTGWVFSSNLVATVSQIALGLLAARILGPQAFGVFGLATAYASIVGEFLGLRSWEILVRFLPELTASGHFSSARSLFRASARFELVASGISTVLVWLTSESAGRFFHVPEDHLLVLKISALALLANAAAGSATGVIRVLGMFRKQAYVESGITLLRLAAGSIALLLGGGVLALAWVFATTPLVRNLCLWGLALAGMRSAGWQAYGEEPPSSLPWPEVYKFAANTYLTSSVRGITRQIDTLAVGYFLTPMHVGFYRVARRLVDFLMLIADSVYQVVYPHISLSRSRNDLIAVTRLIQSSLLIAGLPTLLGAVILFAGAGAFINLTAGPQFLPGVPGLRIMLWVAPVWAMAAWAPAISLAMGRPWAIALGELMSAAIFLSVTLLLLVIGMEGLSAVAVAYLLSRGAATAWLAGFAMQVFQNSKSGPDKALV